jgi:hypothetical protein
MKTDFLVETQSDALPSLRRDGMNVIYPAFIREETIIDENGERKNYRYFIVVIPFTGQPLDDDAAFEIAAYAELRKHFYGPQEFQAELKDDKIWEAHRQAVRSAFPKYVGEINEQQARFDAIKAAFWSIIAAALKSIGKTRQDLPGYFNAEEMVAFARANGMDETTIQAVAAQIEIVSLDLLHNNRNWSELFD